MSLLVWQTGGCYCKVVATIVDRWMLLLGGCCRQIVYCCVSGSMVDRWLLL